MKKQLLIFAFTVLAGLSYSQDQLFKKDNTKLLVKITEVSTEEIKYKLYDNLNGPVYVLSKSEISMLIYENGKHEVINTESPALPPPVMSAPRRPAPFGMRQADSLLYYKYVNSLSLNFLSFANMEVGLIYQREFLKDNLNIIIPLAVGVEKPSVTESIYYNNRLDLNRKLFEVGLGFNYYPSLRFPVNYYVGPTVRFMQYDCQQVYRYSSYNPQTGVNNYNNIISKNGILSSYCVSVTNGFMFRTKSRLIMNMYASVGFKNDQVNTNLVDPATNIKINPLVNTINLYFVTGMALGFGF